MSRMQCFSLLYEAFFKHKTWVENLGDKELYCNNVKCSHVLSCFSCLERGVEVIDGM